MDGFLEIGQLTHAELPVSFTATSAAPRLKGVVALLPWLIVAALLFWLWWVISQRVKEVKSVG